MSFSLLSIVDWWERFFWRWSLISRVAFCAVLGALWAFYEGVIVGFVVVLFLLLVRNWRRVWLLVVALLLGFLVTKSAYRERALIPQDGGEVTLNVERVFNLGSALVESENGGRYLLNPSRLCHYEVGQTLVGVVGVRSLEDSDFSAFLRQERVQGRLTLVWLEPLRPEPATWYESGLQWVRNRFLAGLSCGLEAYPEEAELLKGLVLGERFSEESGLTRVFRESGLLHLFSVSGLHVGLAAGGLWLLFYALGWVEYRICRLMVLLGVWLYVVITGAETPALRAGVMLTYAYVGWENRWRVDWWTVWSVTLVVFMFLLGEPLMILQLGFLLSFGVSAALIAFAGKVYHSIEHLGGWNPLLPKAYYNFFQKNVDAVRTKLLGLVSVSGVATVMSFPLVAWKMKVLNLNGFLGSFLVSYPVLIAMGLGLFSGVLGVCGVDSSWVNQVNRPFLRSIKGAAEFAQGSQLWLDLNQQDIREEVIYSSEKWSVSKVHLTPYSVSYVVEYTSEQGRVNWELPELESELQELSLTAAEAEWDMIQVPIPQSESGGLSVRKPGFWFRDQGREVLVVGHLNEAAQMRVINHYVDSGRSWDLLL